MNAETLAKKDYQLAFPRDHGSHPDYELEWWYLTGQLFLDKNKIFNLTAQFGFQLTFFRSLKDKKQFFLAHAALTDLQNNTFYKEQRFASASLGIANAAMSNLSVQHADWRLQEVADELHIAFSVTDAGKSYDILLKSKMPEPLLHGERGYSKKASCENCASHYYSLPRLTLEGSIKNNSKTMIVQGLGWYDHEFMSSELQSSQLGWDWMSLMFKDGRNLMLFQVRDKNPENYFGAFTLQDGNTITKGEKKDFSLKPLRYWTEKPGVSYPVSFLLKISKLGLELPIESLMDNQVHQKNTALKSPAYWEGAVSTSDNSVLGYLEMTGYEN